MKVYPPCPRCDDKHPEDLTSVDILEDNPSISSILKCQKCGFIYRRGKEGEYLDRTNKNVDSRKISKLSKNKHLRKIFKTIGENKGINITGLAKKLKIKANSYIGSKVSELEKYEILEVRYLGGNQRVLSVAQSKAANLFRELIQEYL